MKTHRTLCPLLFWGICAFLTVTAVLDPSRQGAAGQASVQGDSIWTFDFRDTFYDAAFLSPRDAVIVGDRGRVLVTHPKYKNLWNVRPSGTKEILTCLSFGDAKHGWAAGHGGIILHTKDGGHTWQIQRESSPENQPLFDIQCVSAQVGYACGAFDTFLKTRDGGRTWTEMPTGLDNMYNGLAFLGEERGYMVGEFGTVLHTLDGGGTWERLPLGDYQGSLFGIVLLSPEKILVHGIAGKVMRSADGGRTWEDVSPGVRQSLFRAAVNGDEVLLVGGSGTILHSRDGGKRFEAETDEELTSFAGLCAHPGGGFLCVGERGKIFRFHQTPETD